MLTNECHGCANYIEFPEHGVGEEIHCPHCGIPVVLTESTRTRPPASGNLQQEQKLELRKSFGHAKGDDLARAVEPNKAAAETPVSPEPGGGLRPAPVKSLALVGSALLLVAVVVSVGRAFWRHEPVAVISAEHLEAINRLEQDALAVRAPPGLFGAKWLMTPAEVMKVATNAKPVAPGILRENRTFYDRPAQVTYHFGNDALLLIEVGFSGPGTAADFTQTQARLVTDYGKMPAPAAAEGYVLSSRKKMGAFVLHHCLADSARVQTERLFLYVGKGGENLLKGAIHSDGTRPDPNRQKAVPLADRERGGV